MKKLTFLCLAFAALLVQITLASAQSADTGSVQGFVHIDTNGDGICQDGIPLPGIAIDIEIESVNSKLRVFSSSDGSYNVGSSTQGNWTLKASSRSNRWVAVPPNPQTIEITHNAGLTQNDINFCMQRAAVAVSNVNTQPGNSPVSTPPTAEPPLNSETSGMSLPEQSESLLTNPPVSIQPSAEQLATIENETLEEQAVSVDTWLDYANSIRAMAGVPAVNQDDSLTAGAQAHARYMVVHDRPIAHAEDKSFALYSQAGHIAATNSLIFSTSQIQADHTWAFNFWTSGTFHLIPLIDPYLKTVGYGGYNQDIGNFKMAAVMDVQSGLDIPDGSFEYPVMFPTDGAETWVVRQSLYEWPDPATSCLGFERPTGAPIVLMLQADPTISTAPNVSSYKVEKDGVPISNICMFHENSYTSTNSAEQSIGRTILDLRDAIVLIPKEPLAIHSTYEVEIVANGEIHAWSFTTRKAP